MPRCCGSSRRSTPNAGSRLPGDVDVPDYAARFPELGGDVPRKLGQYVLLERIGSGAMGTVYRAVHRRMKREVAVKFAACRRE